MPALITRPHGETVRGEPEKVLPNCNWRSSFRVSICGIGRHKIFLLERSQIAQAISDRAAFAVLEITWPLAALAPFLQLGNGNSEYSGRACGSHDGIVVERRQGSGLHREEVIRDCESNCGLQRFQLDRSPRSFGRRVYVGSWAARVGTLSQEN